MPILTRDAILSADDLPRETVPVPEWGGEVLVRTMTGAERDALEGEFMTADKTGKMPKNIRARLAAMTICDESGKPVFTEADIESLAAKSASALELVFNTAMRLNAITSSDVKELEGN